MEFLYIRLEEGAYKFWDQSFSCWIKTEHEATRFSMDDRLCIEKHGFLTGGEFLKVRA